jgi:hypothetical protein
VSDDGRTVVGYGIDPAGGTQAWLAQLPGPGVFEVEIDIKPGSDTNPIQPFEEGVTPVIILGSEAFNVANINGPTLAFGPWDAPPVHEPGGRVGHFEDVNGDGFDDHVSHYVTAETGILWGTGEACVSGDTLEDIPFRGCDAVLVLQLCGIGFELALLVSPLMWLYRRRRRTSR